MEIPVLILTDTISDLLQIKVEISKLNNKISIKKSGGLHDRYILTKGNGWSIGHSLKDFGTKDSLVIKLASSVDMESNFDDRWNKALLIA